MIYQIQENWYRDHIRPRIIRRAIIAFLVAVSVLVSGIFLSSVVAVLVALGAFLFGVSDLFGLKVTKSMVTSLKISISDKGLVFIVGPDQAEVLYPWCQLTISKVHYERDTVKSFLIEDSSRSGSRVCVMGYEDIDRLFAEIRLKINAAGG